MAKLCSSYGSSPSFSNISEWMSGGTSYDDIEAEIGIFKQDIFDDFAWPASIHSDIEKIENGYIHDALSSVSDFSLSPIDIKPEIRNSDCMWSGYAAAGMMLSTSASSSGSADSGSASAVPLAIITGSADVAANTSANAAKAAAQRTPPVVVTSSKLRLPSIQSGHETLKTEIKLEPEDDYEQQLLQHSIPTKSVQQGAAVAAKASSSVAAFTQHMQQILPGMSLLRKSNSTQMRKQQQQSAKQLPPLQIPKMESVEFVLERDTLQSALHAGGVKTAPSAAAYLRPDTPHSLDDDVSGGAEFKHNVDLRACVMGSNNIALTSDPTLFISKVCAELQDTSKPQMDLRLADFSLNEVLDVIDKDNSHNHNNNSDNNNNGSISGSAATTTAKLASTLASTLKLRKTLSDTESEDEDVEEEDEEEGEEESLADESSCGDSGFSIMDGDMSYSATSPVPSQASQSSSVSGTRRHHQASYMHSDHSYTRGLDDVRPSLETPSDSDEEIDVVSIGDKKLPTNPSDRDRRALQNKVAFQLSNARIVKTPNGVRTIPPRRRGSYVMPYTPASSSPVKSVVNSRYPSPASTPFQNHYTTKQQVMAILGESSSAMVINDRSRKRMAGVLSGQAGGNGDVLPPSKKNRPKKSLGSGSSSKSTTPSPNFSSLKRHYSIDEAADTIEKRNLHNDMERQRRIGLKNLFESLKKQIPSIKDKERAPKVNILREAAKLCETLTREDQKLIEQKEALKEQMRKRKEHLIRLRAAMAVTD